MRGFLWPKSRLALVEALANGIDFLFQAIVGDDFFADFVTAIHDSGMIAATDKGTDIDQARVRFFAEQVHSHLARADDIAATTTPLEHTQINPIKLTDCAQNHITGYAFFATGIKQIAEGSLGALTEIAVPLSLA